MEEAEQEIDDTHHESEDSDGNVVVKEGGIPQDVVQKRAREHLKDKRGPPEEEILWSDQPSRMCRLQSLDAPSLTAIRKPTPRRTRAMTTISSMTCSTGTRTIMAPGTSSCRTQMEPMRALATGYTNPWREIERTDALGRQEKTVRSKSNEHDNLDTVGSHHTRPAIEGLDPGTICLLVAAI